MRCHCDYCSNYLSWFLCRCLWSDFSYKVGPKEARINEQLYSSPSVNTKVLMVDYSVRQGNFSRCPDFVTKQRGLVKKLPFKYSSILPSVKTLGEAGLHYQRRYAIKRLLYVNANIFKTFEIEPSVWFLRAMLSIRGTSHGPVSVRYKSVFYRNGWTNRPGFWHVSFLPPVLHCVDRKFG